jgi:luciferase family oxidoreductase group 1
MAQRAEERGYQRVWYAEHHNMSSVGSSAPAVLAAHVAAHTSSIRLGAGGVMLPNHSPLTIAEQYGTLAALHPGRIDLGLGRAPGSDQAAAAAMRTSAQRADRFPDDVAELQAYLGDSTRVPGVEATPGKGSHVPLYILGSSLYGAQLAAAMGLPFAFASHFAPESLQRAVAIYRAEFQPSEQLDVPYVIAAVNVLAADTDTDAQAQMQRVMRSRVARFLVKDREVTDEEADALLASPQGRQIAGMMRYLAVGTPGTVREYLSAFAEHADADELITAHASPTVEERLRSLDLTADVALV